MDSAQEDRIVVGIDGSEGSKTALRWAIGQAALTGASLDAVATWQEPVMTGYSYGWQPALDFAEITDRVLSGTVAAVSAEVAPDVVVHTRTIQGHAAQVLPEVATGARMLVVGSRGHGTFAGLMLGSVSQHCVQHAPCPVVVVPASKGS